MEPAKVITRNEELIRLSTYFTKPKASKGAYKMMFKLKIGDQVRITQYFLTRVRRKMDLRGLQRITTILEKWSSYIQDQELS